MAEIIRPEERFIASKNRIQKGLFNGSRLMPSAAINLQEILNKQTFLVNDEEYDKKASQGFIPMVGEVAEKLKASSNLLKSDAFHMPISVAGRHEIYLRNSFLGNPHVTDLKVMQVVLEELAHSYSSETTPRSIYQIPDNSLMLIPFTRPENTLAELEKQRIKLLGKTDEPNPNNFFYQMSGFSTVFSEVAPDGERTLYPGFTIQLALEEARALIVQSIFVSKILGTEKKPYGSLQDQLSTGINTYMMLPESASDYDKQLYGINFLVGYSSPHELGERVRKLMGLLHRPDPDGFRHLLLSDKPDSYKDFTNIVKALEASV